MNFSKQRCAGDWLGRAIAQKKRNFNNLNKIILAEPESHMSMAFVPFKFEKVVRRLLKSDRFQGTILLRLENNDVSLHASLSKKPPEDLLLWASERLFPKNDRVMILSAPDWLSVLLLLMGRPGAFLHERLDHGEQKRMANALQDLYAQRPVLKTSFYTEIPSANLVAALFVVILGRYPNQNDDLSARGSKGLPGLLRSLIRSIEFQRAFIKLLGREALPVDGTAPSNWRKAIADTLNAVGCPQQEMEQILSKGEFGSAIEAMWSNEVTRTRIVGVLSEDSPLDTFVKNLIEGAIERISRRQLPSAVTAFVENKAVKAVIQQPSNQNIPGETLVRILAENGEQLKEINVSLSGSKRQIIEFEWFSADFDPGVMQNTILSFPNWTGQQIPLPIRPNLNSPLKLLAKINWHWQYARFEKARDVILDLELCDDDLVTFVTLRNHRKLTSLESNTPTTLETRDPDWGDLVRAVRARKASGDVFEPGPAVSRALSSRTEGRAVLNWLAGLPKTSLLEELLSTLDGHEPSIAFRAKASLLNTPKQILSGIFALTLADASPDHYAVLSEKLYKQSSLIKSWIKSDIAGLAYGALIQACAHLPSEASTKFGITGGVVKHLESTGRYNKALEICRRVAQDKPGLSSEVYNLVGAIENKHGSAVSAAAYFKKLADENPDRHEFERRYLRMQRGVNIQNPLHLDGAFIRRVKLFQDRTSRELIAQPNSTQRRHDLAEALIIRGDQLAAHNILLSLYNRGAIAPGAHNQLIDLCVKLKFDEQALEIASTIAPEHMTEWVVINQARAYRALQKPEEAGRLLEEHASTDKPSVCYEAIKNLFFLEAYDQAVERGEQACAHLNENIELRLICAAANLETDRLEQTKKHIDVARMLPKSDRFSEEIALFDYAIAQKQSDPRAIEKLNPMFVAMGCADLTIQEGTTGTFDDFRSSDRTQSKNVTDVAAVPEYPPLFDGPLVSVVMTTYNARQYVHTSIRSILEQRYTNIELIIVDDNSDDDTQEILKYWSTCDPRIRVILRSVNNGTYVSKNTGILQARGKYVALQDSDDWSHPDRIGKSVAVLEKRSDIKALTTDWIRMTSDGALVVKAGGQISHVCCISLVFERGPVLDEIGFFDSVRIEADMEFIKRIRLSFGGSAVSRLRWPLLLGRARSDSLTGNEEFGISRTAYSQPRVDYQASQNDWHTYIINGTISPYMPFPLLERKFPAPGIILPEKIEEALQ